MRQLIIFVRGDFELALKKPVQESDVKTYHPTFKVPVPFFLSSGAVWSALHLSTIFWERPAWGIKHEPGETDSMKKAYLLAFANYDAPISKAWTEKTLLEDEWITSGAYFELVIYNPALVEKIKGAFQRHGIHIIDHENNFFSLVQ
jgi:hypothetical protein